MAYNNSWRKNVKVRVTKSMTIDSRILVSNFKKRVASEFGIEDGSQIDLIIDGKILSNNQNLKPISNGTTIDLDSEVNETKVTKQNQKVDQQKAKTKSHIKPIRNLRSNQKMAHGTKRAILKRLDKKEIIKDKNKKPAMVSSFGNKAKKAIGKRGRKLTKNFPKMVKTSVKKIGEDKSTCRIHSDIEVTSVVKPKPTKNHTIPSNGSKSNTKTKKINSSVPVKKHDQNIHSKCKNSEFDIKIRLVDQKELIPLSSCPNSLFEDFAGYCQKNRTELEDLLEWND